MVRGLPGQVWPFAHKWKWTSADQWWKREMVPAQFNEDPWRYSIIAPSQTVMCLMLFWNFNSTLKTPSATEWCLSTLHRLGIRICPNGIPPVRWRERAPFSLPPRSPDLTIYDYLFLRQLKDIIYHEPPNTISELENNIRQAGESIDEDTLKNLQRIEKHLFLVMRERGVFIL